MNKNRVVTATEFRAKCLSLLDAVERDHATIIVTKRGRAVAMLGPTPKRAFKSPRGSWARRARIVGDIVNPDASVVWEVVS